MTRRTATQASMSADSAHRAPDNTGMGNAALDARRGIKESSLLKSSQYHAGHDDIEDGLLRSIVETERFVSASSLEAEEFNRLCHEIVATVHPDYNLDRYPVRFVIKDSNDLDAAYMPAGNPPIILVSRAMFEVQESIGEPIIQTLDEFVWLIACHEWRHKEIRDEFGLIKNSKLEEYSADTDHIETMYRAGFDPRTVQQFLERLHHHTEFELEKAEREARLNGLSKQSKIARIIGRLIDVHLPLEDRITSIKAELSKLYEKGPIDASPRLIDSSHPIPATIAAAHHISFVEGWKQRTQYQDLNTEEKISVLSEMLEADQFRFEVRQKEIAREVAALDIQTDTERAAVTKLANQSRLAITTKHRVGEFNPVYNACCFVLTGIPSTTAVGELARLHTAIRNFVEARSDAEILQAAEQLLDQWAQEPLFTAERGIEFLRLIPWPDFTLDDVEIDQPFFQDEDDLDYDEDDEEDVDQEELEERYHDYVESDEWKEAAEEFYPWNRHLNVAQRQGQDNPVALALVSLGVLDRRLLNKKTLSPETARRVLTEDFPILHESRVSEITTEILEIHLENEFGSTHRAVTAHCEKELPLEQYSLLAHFCGSIPPTRDIRKIFFDLVYEEKKTSDRLMQGVIQELVGLEELPDNIAEFVLRHREALKHRPEQARAMLQRLEEACDTEKREAAVLALRQIFGLEEYTGLAEDQLLVIAGEPATNFEYLGREYENEQGYSKGSLNVTTNPYIATLIRNPGGAFSPADQVWFYGAQLSRSIERATLYDVESELSARDAEGLPFVLISILSRMHPELTLDNWQDWEVLSTALDWANSIERGAENSLHKGNIGTFLCFLCQYQLKKETPTLAQFSRLARALPPEVSSELRQKFDRVASELIEHLDQHSPEEALHIWSNLYSARLLQNDAQYFLFEKLLDSFESSSPGPENQLRVMEEILCSRPLGHPHLRERVIELWADALVARHGQDPSRFNDVPGSNSAADSYRATIRKDIEQVVDTTLLSGRTMLVKEALVRLAERISAQPTLALELKDLLPKLGAADLKNSEAPGLLSQASMEALREDPEGRRETLEFLISPLSDESIERFTRQLERTEKIREELEMYGVIHEDYLEDLQSLVFAEEERMQADPSYKPSDEYHRSKKEVERMENRKRLFFVEHARLLHLNFWASSIGVRSVIANELLLSPSKKVSDLDQAAFNYVAGKCFPEDEQYSREARIFVDAYLRSLPDYVRSLGMTALLVASQRKQSERLSPGETLALFLEHAGPFPIKAGQAAASHPDTPQEFSHPLERLKFDADKPARWEFVEWILSGVPEKERLEYIRLGDIQGSASFNVTCDVQLRSRRTEVLSLLRPGSTGRSKEGERVFTEMIERVRGKVSEEVLDTISQLVEQAAEDSKEELATQDSKQKYDIGQEIYQKLEINIDGSRFSFSSAAVTACGAQHKRMSKIKGKHFSELPEKSQRQKDRKAILATAILTVELNNIARGVFDSDRHGGNCKIRGSHIGHFDLGSLPLEHPTEEALEQLGEVLFRALLNANEGRSIADSFRAELRNIKELTGSIPPLLRRAQKALLSLGDYIRYVSKEDLQRAFVSAALQDPHPALKRGVLKNAAQLMNHPAANSMRTLLFTGQGKFTISRS